MNIFVYLIKATGVVHWLHGGILACLAFMMLFSGIEAESPALVFIMLLISGVLRLYLGYEIRALRSPKRMAILLTAAILLAGFSVFSEESAGPIFILELVMSVISLGGIGVYKKYKELPDEDSRGSSQ